MSSQELLNQLYGLCAERKASEALGLVYRHFSVTKSLDDPTKELFSGVLRLVQFPQLDPSVVYALVVCSFIHRKAIDGFTAFYQRAKADLMVRLGHPNPGRMFAAFDKRLEADPNERLVLMLQSIPMDSQMRALQERGARNMMPERAAETVKTLEKIIADAPGVADRVLQARRRARDLEIVQAMEKLDAPDDDDKKDP